MPTADPGPRVTAPSLLATVLALLVTYGLLKATLNINGSAR